MDGKVYLARRRNLLGEPQANLITSGAEPDQFFPFSGTDPIILFILLLNFSRRFIYLSIYLSIYQSIYTVRLPFRVLFSVPDIIFSRHLLKFVFINVYLYRRVP